MVSNSALTTTQSRLLASIGELDAKLSVAAGPAQRQGLVYEVLSGEGAILSRAAGVTLTGFAPGDMHALVDQGFVTLSRGDRGRVDLTSRGRELLRSRATETETAPKVPHLAVSSTQPRLSSVIGLAGAIAGAAGIGLVVYFATGELVASSSLAIAALSLAVSVGAQLLDRADVRPTVSLEGKRTRPVVVLTPVNHGRRAASVVAAGFCPDRSGSPRPFDAFLIEYGHSRGVPIAQPTFPIPVPAGMPADRSLRVHAYAIRLELAGRPPRHAWCQTATGAIAWLELPEEFLSLVAAAEEWVQRRSPAGDVIEVPLTEADQHDLP